MKVKNNPTYKHYKKYDYMINNSNLQALLCICYEIVDYNVLKNCYLDDKNLNNIPKNKESIEAAKSREIQVITNRYKKRIENSGNYEKIQSLVYEMKDKIRKVKSYNNRGQLAHFDVYFMEVYRLTNGDTRSIADCTCILKHVMKYYILKVDRPKTFIKISD